MSAPRGARAGLVLIWASVVVPSLSPVEKYLGVAGFVAYAVAVAVVLALAWRRGWVERALVLAGDRRIRWVLAAALVALVAAFAVVYPIADARRDSGAGSDRDDALNVAVDQLLAGNDPYAERTYLGLFPGPMPGSFLLALPFAVVGSSAIQNVVWVAAFVAAVWWFTSDRRMAVLTLGTVAALTPAFWQDYLEGSDLNANTLFVLVFTLVVLRTQLDPDDHPPWLRIGGLVALGIALASRGNYAFVLAPLLVAVAGRRGVGPAVRAVAVPAVIAAAVNLPFYLADRRDYPPLEAQDKLSQFEEHFGLVVPFTLGFTVVAVVVSALVLARRGDVGFLVAVVIGQAAPILCGIVFTIAWGGNVDVGADQRFQEFPIYGLAFLWPGVLAAWLVFRQRFAPQEREPARAGGRGRRV